MSLKRAAGVLVAMTTLLVGCASSVHPQLRRACLSGDDRSWAVVSPDALPIDAAILYRVADANPVWRTNDFNREAWFSLTGKNRIKLCRADRPADLANYYAGAWWEFDVSGPAPELVDSDGWLTT